MRKHLKTILAVFLIFVLSSCTSNSKNPTNSESAPVDPASYWVGTYVGNQGSVITLFSDKTADYFWNGWKKIYNNNTWEYSDGQLTINLTKPKCKVTVTIGDKPDGIMNFVSSSTSWDNEKFIKVSDADKKYTSDEYLKMLSEVVFETKQKENKSQVTKDETVYFITNSELNVRAGVGTSYDVVYQADASERLELTGNEETTSSGAVWVEVKVPDGNLNGWVNSKYGIKENHADEKNTAQEPVSEAPTAENTDYSPSELTYDYVFWNAYKSGESVYYGFDTSKHLYVRISKKGNKINVSEPVSYTGNFYSGIIPEGAENPTLKIKDSMDRLYKVSGDGKITNASSYYFSTTESKFRSVLNKAKK